ncbi:MAG: RluA family pseudouridine synthase [Propionibacteriaceae bacterium]|nr:RluA family pseudouridine synthase [Propionibacteriaceae bacterium]
MSVFLVPDGLDGERIDTAAARMTGWSRSRLADHVAAGRVVLDGVTVDKPSLRVKAGQMLDIDEMDAPTVTVVPQLADGVRIVHLDESIVVIDKPAGVAAHPSQGWAGPNVVAHLVAAGVSVATSGPPERQGIVQRLDVGTSGLMVVTRSEAAYSALKQQFRAHTVEKVYTTVVQGHPDPPVGTIDAPIGRASSNQWRFAVRDDGRRSVTHYETIELMRGAAALRIRLETGRTHQIRVHMAALRHPVVGDPLYGCDPVLAARLGLERQWLHAVQLGFVHPATSQWVQFTSEPADDLRRALDLLRQG